ncbi:MAG: hypothetical protein ABI887_03305 [Burkholderiales bacterium]
MSTTRRILLASLALGAVMLWVPAAQAQAINKCMTGGHLVFQSSPCALEARAGVPAAPIVVASGNPGAPKKKTLADVLRERDGDVSARPASREPQGDGANVLRSRMGAL